MKISEISEGDLHLIRTYADVAGLSYPRCLSIAGLAVGFGESMLGYQPRRKDDGTYFPLGRRVARLRRFATLAVKAQGR